MGLQQGFDSFTDESLRQDHPLLSRKMWREVFMSLGYTAFEAFSVPGSVAEQVGFEVLAVQGPAVTSQGLLPELQRHVSARLPAYMCPSVYFALAELPKGANSKVDRKALQKRSESIGMPANEYAAPATELETALCAIWRQVLNVEQVGVTSSFFDLGGDSLLAVRMAALVQARLGRPVSLRKVFKHPTIRALIEALTSESDPVPAASAAGLHYFGRENGSEVVEI
jgi:yersiniabactin nonribosomal peptide synthetase